MMNVLDFEVLNGSPGDNKKQTKDREEVYQSANGMKSLKKKKRQQNWTRADSAIPSVMGPRLNSGGLCTSTSNHVYMTMTSDAPGSVSDINQSIHIPLTAVQHGIVTLT